MTDDCRAALERAYLYLDGEVLTQEQRLEIRRHLEECPPCLERYDVEQVVAKLVARVRGSETCPARVKERVQSLLEEA
jgi:mycothiol system anti-sigma-R factor